VGLVSDTKGAGTMELGRNVIVPRFRSIESDFDFYHFSKKTTGSKSIEKGDVVGIVVFQRCIEHFGVVLETRQDGDYDVLILRTNRSKLKNMNTVGAGYFDELIEREENELKDLQTLVFPASMLWELKLDSHISYYLRKYCTKEGFAKEIRETIENYEQKERIQSKEVIDETDVEKIVEHLLRLYKTGKYAIVGSDGKSKWYNVHSRRLILEKTCKERSYRFKKRVRLKKGSNERVVARLVGNDKQLILAIVKRCKTEEFVEDGYE
jgi:hypothetical protein